MRPHGGSRQQLVDPEVGRAEEADVPVGAGEARGPVDELGTVGRLHRIEQPERPVRVAGAPDVGDHLV